MLVKLDGSYAEGVFKLSRNNNEAEYPGFRMDSIYDVMDHIKKMNEEEEKGTTYSRGILDEDARLAGIASLVNIDRDRRNAELEMWIVEDKPGFYAAAIKEMLKAAFSTLPLDEVYISVHKMNELTAPALETLVFAKSEGEKQMAGIPEKPAEDGNPDTHMLVISKEVFFDF
ncbi:GNAT family N-acetyltransferase [Bacillus marinisedimentorum]|uniref:GNAT family N-acetyltransferase n=1 Tax=Bacillus marinisedimentorum TaxID=1821260 RepID=UPI000872906E|nr:GNAT family N-acetyltransferase [Bacillus marinisedimentorum]